MKNRNQASLKTKLIGLSVGLLVLMGTSALLMMNHIIGLQESSQSDAFEAYAQNLGNAVSAQFYERYGDVQTFALSPAIRSSDKKLAVEELDSYALVHGIYDLVMVVDKNGHLMAVNDKSTEGKDLKVEKLYLDNYSNTNWFKAAMAGQFTDDESAGLTGTYFEDVQADPYITAIYGVKTLGTGFTTSIKNEQGEVVGVISVRASSHWFGVAFEEAYDMLKKQNLPNSNLMLLSKDGTLIYEYNRKTSEAESKSEDSHYDWTRLLAFNPAKDGNASAANAVAKKSGSAFQKNSQSGVVEVTGYTPVNSSKFITSIGWSVLVRDNVDEAFGKIFQAKKIFYLIFFAMLAFGLVVAFWYSGTISKRLLALAKTLSSGGDSVATAAAQISQSSAVLSEASVKQASAVQETAASIDEVSAMVKKNSENAAQSQVTSQGSREAAEKGQAAIQKMIQSITEMSESNNLVMNQVTEGNQKISDIVKLITEIGNKTKVINDIVFQTKLLSFNASVEAARAGEHGKGFAVVAEEVGNLAQMSGNAAKEISELLDGSVQKVEGIISETKKGVESLVTAGRSKVESGKETARECGEILNEILSSVQDVDGMVSEISSASKEQSEGVEEIGKAMNQLDQAIQQNSAVSQSSAASAKELNHQSENMRKLVAELSFLVTGRSDSTGVQTTLPTKKKIVEAVGPKVLAFDSSKRKSKSKPVPVPVQETEPKITVGGGSVIPLHDDPRFEDV